MDQQMLLVGAWIGTGTVGLVTGMFAVAVTKRRMHKSAVASQATDEPLPA